MWLGCGLIYFFSLRDLRTLRKVGAWVKPVKFMAATALFAWTTVLLTERVNAPLSYGPAYIGICILLVVTSLFEVAYITYQPPEVTGLPLVGWRLYKNIRSSYFLGAHAQQLFPLWAIFAKCFLGNYSTQALAAGCSLYLIDWGGADLEQSERLN